MILMVIRDYKSSSRDQTLGLKRGKSAIKREGIFLTRRKIIMWVILFGLVLFLNYLFFTHLEPINKKEINKEFSPKEQSISDTIAQLLDKGNKRYQEGNFMEAIAAFSKAIRLNPKETRAYLERGIVYSNMGMYDKAINDCTKVITLHPDHAEAYHKRGMAYEARGRVDMAKKDFQKSCKLGIGNGCQAYNKLLRKNQ